MGENHILSPYTERKFLTDWFIKYYYGSFFLYGMNLSIFLPLKSCNI